MGRRPRTGLDRQGCEDPSPLGVVTPLPPKNRPSGESTLAQASTELGERAPVVPAVQVVADGLPRVSLVQVQVLAEDIEDLAELAKPGRKTSERSGIRRVRLGKFIDGRHHPRTYLGELDLGRHL